MGLERNLDFDSLPVFTYLSPTDYYPMQLFPDSGR